MHPLCNPEIIRKLDVIGKLIIILELGTFLLTFWHTIKQIWIMSLQCCYTKYIAWHVSIAAQSVVVQKWEDPKLYIGS